MSDIDRLGKRLIELTSMDIATMTHLETVQHQFNVAQCIMDMIQIFTTHEQYAASLPLYEVLIKHIGSMQLGNVTAAASYRHDVSRRSLMTVRDIAKEILKNIN